MLTIPPTEYPEPILFDSHAAVDAELALPLKRAVVACFPSLTIFDASDPESLKPTEDWVHSVLDNLRATNLVLVIATERSMKRQWVWFEAGASWERTSRLATFQFWMNLQSLHDLRLAQEEAGKSIKALPTLKRTNHFSIFGNIWQQLAHRAVGNTLFQ